ncbi:diphthamide synthesis DPH2 family protein [Trifolium repens]|nr:diphthamide synthesis DPH2 family protein [Trifolium repens]
MTTVLHYNKSRSILDILSWGVIAVLRKRLQSLRESDITEGGEETNIGLYVIADMTYGSCCVDEVGASHINADRVIHYGQTCFSPTTALPAFFVFGKASIGIADCVESMSQYALTNSKPIMVLFGLEYAHSIQQIRKALLESSTSCKSDLKSEFHFADVPSPYMFPSKDIKKLSGIQEEACGCAWKTTRSFGLDKIILLLQMLSTFNACEIVRYDATKNQMVTDLSQQRRILKRRYYLVERAKDANIVGILVGTLGVAGYLHIINQMMELITATGKKAYTLVMGKPNPAKLANFPEFDVFLYVSCAQTSLLDSKEYLAPVITPFEATIAFNRYRVSARPTCITNFLFYCVFPNDC